MTKTKSKPAKANDNLNGVHMLRGADDFRPRIDTAWDIETQPLTPEGNGLSAETARVAAIGYFQPDECRYFIAYDDDESLILHQFWGAFLSAHAAGAKMLGFNIFGFDLPFLVRRSWHHGVPVPKNLFGFGGRSFNETFVDLMAAWKCGEWKTFISLDNLAQFLNVGGKNGSGEHFWKMWETDRDAAIDYLQNDVRLVIDCAVKMGLTSEKVA